MSNKRPSPTQQEAIHMISEHGGVIERWKGGFWTYSGCEIRRHVTDGNDNYDVPAWSVGSQTVDALVKRGWFARCHKHAEAFRDDYRLTRAAYEVAELTLVCD